MQRRNVVNLPEESLQTVRNEYTKVYSIADEDLETLLPEKHAYRKAQKTCSLPPIQFEVQTQEISAEFHARQPLDHFEPLLCALNLPDLIPRRLTLTSFDADLKYPVFAASSFVAFAKFSNESLVKSDSANPLERLTPESVLKEGIFLNLPAVKTSKLQRGLVCSSPYGSRSSAYACAQRPESLELGSYRFTSPHLQGEWVCVRGYHLLSIFAVSNWQTLKLHFVPFKSKKRADFYIFPLQLCEFIKTAISGDLALHNPILPSGQFCFTLQRNPCNVNWGQESRLRLNFELEYLLLPEELPTTAQPTIPDLRDEFCGFCNTAEMKLDSGQTVERILQGQK